MRDKISQLFCLQKNTCKNNSADNRGHNVPTKATSNGTLCANGTEGPEATETDSSGTGRMRKPLERNGSTQNDTVHLERRLGLFSGVALIVGTMIGSGIFVSPSGLLVRTGSVGVSFIIWLACGLLSLLDEEQADNFASHLEERFTPFDLPSPEELDETTRALETPLQMSPPIGVEEVINVVKVLPRAKAPGHDEICHTILKALPMRALLFITLIFNAILRTQHFPAQW
ncbi:uncharacterized protein LOC135439566, partial [Drosophila montana]|uniref:uncharacterized protein LOC135439566 n=1 Tax=Drosophila montana TaxID=40370 RepID=UPI00313EC093